MRKEKRGQRVSISDLGFLIADFNKETFDFGFRIHSIWDLGFGISDFSKVRNLI